MSSSCLPLVDEYEPGAREVHEYFKAVGNNYVFPFNRQQIWHYITLREQIFAGLTYRIKKYVYSKEKTEAINIDQLKESAPEVFAKLLVTRANN